MDTLRSYWDRFLEVDGPVHLLIGAGIAALFWLLAYGLSVFNRRVLTPRATGEGRSQQRYQLLAAAERPLTRALVVFGLYLASVQLPIVQRAHRIVNDVLFALGALLVVHGLQGIARVAIDAYAARVAERHGEAPDVALFSLLRTVAGLFLWLIGAAVVLHRFKIDIGSVLAALGVGSLAVGLAAKDTLGNMIAGFIILIDRPFREGDRIKLVSGEVGDVREIGLRSTKIALFDDTWLVVPNTELVNLRLVNQAYPTRRIRGQILLGLEYGADVRRVKEGLVEVLRQHAEVLATPPPAAEVAGFGASTLDVQLLFWVADYARLGPVTEELRVACYERLPALGAALAYPTQTVHLRRPAAQLHS